MNGFNERILELRVVAEVVCEDLKQTLDHGTENNHTFQ
jgi:hypothetical protein